MADVVKSSRQRADWLTRVQRRRRGRRERSHSARRRLAEQVIKWPCTHTLQRNAWSVLSSDWSHSGLSSAAGNASVRGWPLAAARPFSKLDWPA